VNTKKLGPPHLEKARSYGMSALPLTGGNGIRNSRVSQLRMCTMHREKNAGH
jgi:hypothetical protein